MWHIIRHSPVIPSQRMKMATTSNITIVTCVNIHVHLSTHAQQIIMCNICQFMLLRKKYIKKKCHKSHYSRVLKHSCALEQFSRATNFKKSDVTKNMTSDVFAKWRERHIEWSLWNWRNYDHLNILVTTVLCRAGDIGNIILEFWQ